MDLSPPRMPEESVEYIMRFLGSSSPTSVLDRPTISRALYDYGSSTETIQAGIQICIDNGWLEVSGEGWRTTPAGLIEVQRVAEEQRLLREAELARGEVWFNAFGLTLRSRRGAMPLAVLTFVILFGLPIWALYWLLGEVEKAFHLK